MKFTFIAMLLSAGIGWAQTPSRPEFEVASIKINKIGGGTTFGAGNGGSGGRNVTLKALMAFAYRIQAYQILGGPSWVSSDRFDIEARAADRNSDPDQLRLMLQSLFEDRFQLRIHREMQLSNVYALVVGKKGSRLKSSLDQISPDVNGPSAPGAGPNRGVIRMVAGSMTGNAVPLSHVTSLLSNRLDRIVIDKTNLTGRFDLQLQWTPDIEENPLSPGGDPIPSAPADPSRPSNFVAIQEQLGLKLEPQKAPIEVLIIDHVERPSEN
jgi:uncharacterized protein (TIGR03435 family)